jgi:carbon monoxide dehydrogenase subunit G
MMRSHPVTLSTLSTLSTLLLLAVAPPVERVARADTGPSPSAAQDPEVVRILQAKSTLRWSYVPSGKTERYGHAETLVQATPEKVRQTAVDYAHYKELHRKFSGARVVGKEGDATDVYLKLPVQVGPVKLDQWEIIRFTPARAAGSGYVVEGRGVKGSMKAGHIVISVRPVDDKHSLLKIDLLLVPGMPAPQAMIDEELRDAALDLANGLKDKAQGWVGPVTSL